MPHAVPFAEIFLAMAVITVAARLFGKLFQRFHQPAVVGEIVAGLLLGATALAHAPGDLTEHLFPLDTRPYLQAIAALGLVLFMFIVGLELDLKVVRGQERLATAISLSSIALPFCGGIALGVVLYTTHPPPGSGQSRLTFALFIGAAMSITAFPVLARILADRKLLKTPLGGLALASAAVDDVVAWSLLAVVVVVAGPGPDGGGGAQWHIWLTIPYLIAMFTAVPKLLDRVVQRYRLIGRLTPDLLAVILVGVLASAYATDWLGIHYIFGAFLFGAVMPREGAHSMYREILERLEQVSVLLLLPVFFVVTGLAVDFWNMGPHWWWQLPAVLGVAIAGKFLGAFGAARFHGVPRPRSAALAVLMNTRGLTEIVILTVGKQKGILDDELFSMMVFMAVFTTLMTGPLLRVVYSDRRLARDIAEAERAAVGLPYAYRVLVSTAPDGARTAVVGIARAVVAHERPAELVLAQIRPVATPALEVGHGLSVELFEFAESAERLEALRRQLEASAVPTVTLVRMSDDLAGELASMVSDLEADVLVVDGRDGIHAALTGQVRCQVVSVTSRGGPDVEIRRVGIVVGGGRNADAAVEIGLRIAIAQGAAIAVLDAASPGDRSRRASALASALTRAGLTASEQAVPEVDVLVTALGVEPAADVPVLLHVSAEQDRDVLSPDRLVAAVRAKVAAPL